MNPAIGIYGVTARCSHENKELERSSTTAFTPIYRWANHCQFFWFLNVTKTVRHSTRPLSPKFCFGKVQGERISDAVQNAYWHLFTPSPSTLHCSNWPINAQKCSYWNGTTEVRPSVAAQQNSDSLLKKLLMWHGTRNSVVIFTRKEAVKREFKPSLMKLNHEEHTHAYHKKEITGSNSNEMRKCPFLKSYM